MRTALVSTLDNYGKCASLDNASRAPRMQGTRAGARARSSTTRDAIAAPAALEQQTMMTAIAWRACTRTVSARSTGFGKNVSSSGCVASLRCPFALSIAALPVLRQGVLWSRMMDQSCVCPLHTLFSLDLHAGTPWVRYNLRLCRADVGRHHPFLWLGCCCFLPVTNHIPSLSLIKPRFGARRSFCGACRLCRGPAARRDSRGAPSKRSRRTRSRRSARRTPWRRGRASTASKPARSCAGAGARDATVCAATHLGKPERASLSRWSVMSRHHPDSAAVI